MGNTMRIKSCKGTGHKVNTYNIYFLTPGTFQTFTVITFPQVHSGSVLIYIHHGPVSCLFVLQLFYLTPLTNLHHFLIPALSLSV